MTAFSLLAGTLYRAPDQKTSKAGKPYVTATLKVVAGNETEFWRLIVFSESAQTELMRLSDGDKLSAQGSLKIELYQANDGSQKLSRTLMTDSVLALKPAPRERKVKPSIEVSSTSAKGGDLNDDLPF